MSENGQRSQNDSARSNAYADMYQEQQHGSTSK